MKKSFVLTLFTLFQLQVVFVCAQKNHYYSVQKTGSNGKKNYTLFTHTGHQLISTTHDWISMNTWKWIFLWDNHQATVCDSLGHSLGIEGIEEIHHLWGNSELLPLKKKGLWGYYARNGRLKIPHIYEEAALFEDNQAAVKLNGKYCYIDPVGNVLDQPFTGSPDEIFMIIETTVGLTGFSNFPQELVEENGKFGLRDKSSGKMLIKCLYDGLYNITDRAVIVEKNGRYGVVDFKGRIVLPIEYEMIYLLGE